MVIIKYERVNSRDIEKIFGFPRVVSETFRGVTGMTVEGR